MIHKLRKVVSVLLLTAALAIGFCTPSYAAGIPTGEWKLTSLNGTSPVGQTPILIIEEYTSEKDGVRGTAECNTYFSTFNKNDSSQIALERIIITRTFCDSYMNQDFRYFEALQNVKTYSVDGTTLSLTNPDRKIDLKFSKS